MFTFNSSLSSVGGAVVSAGTVKPDSAINRNNPLEYILELTGVTSGQYLTVTLTNVNGASNIGPVTVGVLVGDMSGTDRSTQLTLAKPNRKAALLFRVATSEMMSAQTE